MGIPPFEPQHQEWPGLDSKMSPRPRHAGESYKPADKLLGKKALVTGGDSGIGRAVVTLFAKEGADVAIVYTPQEQSDADEVKAEVEAIGRKCVLIPGDLAEEPFCREAVQTAVDGLGGLDILVNNASVMFMSDSIEELPDEQFERVFKVNVFAYFRTIKAAAKHLAASEGKPGGCVINTGSIAGLMPFASGPDYGASKAAEHSLTWSLSKQLLKRGIRVNCVAPGPVWTPLNAQARPADGMATYAKESPMGRPAQPEELAPAYVYLASNADSGYVTGEIIKVCGGEAV
ncbi:General stress protein 39 [Planctomycetes bacterium LzC2]|uniref:General stress protein 39 n=1 Tax=Alienimonas chondri TaxID=2681879 RepID=A0ABX1VHD4_9PLAN|nr:General stress protein 39 [Alienimonas chondri]